VRTDYNGFTGGVRTDYNGFTGGVRTDYNGFTGGVRYAINRYMVLRPELRHDWQNAAHGSASNSNRGRTQVTGTTDLPVYF